MIRKLLTPAVARFISSDMVLNTKRMYYNIRHAINKKPHCLKVFVAIDDAYSYLLLQSIPLLLKRFNVTYQLVLIDKRDSSMFPDLAKWHQYSQSDAAALATLYQFEQPPHTTQSIDDKTTEHYLSLLLTACQNNNVEQAITLIKEYWQPKSVAEFQALGQSQRQQLDRNFKELSQLGHYASAMIHYDGEWYWGLDRLDHLERRLNALSLSVDQPQVYFNRTSQLYGQRLAEKPTTALEIFYSARSPYSYIALEKAAELANRLNVDLIIKPIMPMVMRDLPVPPAKKMYIFHDARREAKKLGIPYGYVADPLGQAVIDCYAIYPYAESQGKSLNFLLSFGQAVNAQGLHADSLKHMETIVNRAGLDWKEAKRHLNNQEYKILTQQNLDQLAELGLWGVPCFKFGETITWGQDRLWIIEQAIMTRCAR